MSATIRIANPDDAVQVAAIYAPYVQNTPVSFEVLPPTETEMSRRIHEVLERMPWLICEVDGEILGYVYATPHKTRVAYQWSIDTAVYIHEAHHRKGVGRALYTSLFALLAYQGYVTAYAGITLPNAGSVGLHETMGFRPLGIYHNVGHKLGKWHDVGWWYLAMQDYAEDPAPPTLLPAMPMDSVWQAKLESGLPLLRL